MYHVRIDNAIITIFFGRINKVEKLNFYAALKQKLSDLKISENIIEKHIKIFDDFFKEKSDSDIDKFFESAGGIDGIVDSIYELESAKLKKINTSDNVSGKILDPEKNSDEVNGFVEKIEEKNEATREINALSSDNKITIDDRIREAEVITNNLENTTVNSVVSDKDDNVEFANDISDYDFQVLFEQKLTLPEKWAGQLKERMNEKTYKNTLPIAALADALLFLFLSLLFPIIVISAVFVGIVYVLLLISGISASLVSIGYGIYMCFKEIPVGLYEIGLGMIVLGFTMLLSILLYNYIKRLVPFLLKKFKEYYAILIKITKDYFSKNDRGESEI